MSKPPWQPSQHPSQARVQPKPIPPNLSTAAVLIGAWPCLIIPSVCDAAISMESHACSLHEDTGFKSDLAGRIAFTRSDFFHPWIFASPYVDGHLILQVFLDASARRWGRLVRELIRVREYHRLDL